MSLSCPNCGFLNEADSKFCAQCGFQVDVVPDSPIQPISPSSHSSSTSSPEAIQFHSSSRPSHSYRPIRHSPRYHHRRCRSAPKRQMSGWVLGAVFLTAGLIFALIILAPLASGGHYTPHSTWSDFGEEMGRIGSDLGDFFSDFGEDMGELGSDLGDAFDQPTDIFNSDFSSFPFRFLTFCILAFFFLFGIVMLVFAARTSRRSV